MTLLYADAAGDTSTLYYTGAGNPPLPATAAGAVPATAVQIAEVTVPNPQGMQSESGTLFKATTASGFPAAPAAGVFASANGTSEKMLSNRSRGQQRGFGNGTR